MPDDIPFKQENGDEETAREEIALENLTITIEAMWRLHSEINEWTRAADIKAGIVLATNGAIIAAIALAVNTASFLAIIEARHLVGAFMLATLAAVVISSVFAALCLVPPLREGEIISPLFTDYIAQRFPTAQAYEETIRATLVDANANLTQISHQVWTSARSQLRKLTYATWGIRFLIASLLFSLLTLLLAFL